MTAIPPPLRAWSKHKKNRCAPGEIAAYWKTCDVLTFLADVGMYNASLLKCLDSAEKERVLEFKSEYFQKRFVVSRSLIKTLLRHIPGTGKREQVALYREKKGILVRDRKDLFVSLSYSGSCIALSLAKTKIGTDLETVNAGEIRKIRSSPLFDGSKCRTGQDESLHALHVWTLVEAYAKLKDQNPYPLLKSNSLLHDACFVSYCIDKRLILSLAYDTGNPDHAMFWIDPGHWPAENQDQRISHFPR